MGGPWDLVCMVISTLIRVISIIGTLTVALVTKSHDPLSIVNDTVENKCCHESLP